MYKFEARVYFSDTDAGGIVYHTHYLDWAEHARTEMMREVLPSLEQSDLKKEGFVFVVKSIDVDYIKPAILDDVITVYTEMEKIENFSAVIHQAVKRDGELLCDIHTKVAFISMETRRPTRIPAELKLALGR